MSWFESQIHGLSLTHLTRRWFQLRHSSNCCLNTPLHEVFNGVWLFRSTLSLHPAPWQWRSSSFYKFFDLKGSCLQVRNGPKFCKIPSCILQMLLCMDRRLSKTVETHGGHTRHISCNQTAGKLVVRNLCIYTYDHIIISISQYYHSYIYRYT